MHGLNPSEPIEHSSHWRQPELNGTLWEALYNNTWRGWTLRCSSLLHHLLLSAAYASIATCLFKAHNCPDDRLACIIRDHHSGCFASCGPFSAFCQQYRAMRSWSPPSQRGLEKRGSVDGYVYKGRFRIRDISFSESKTPSIASEYSTRSAPAAGEAILPADNDAPARSAATGDSSPAPFTDRRSDASDYSFCVAVSETSENDLFGKPDPGVREKETRYQRRHYEQSARLRTRSEGGDRNVEESPSGRESSMSVGETSEASGGYESEQGRRLMVSSLYAAACSSPCRAARGMKSGSVTFGQVSRNERGMTFRSDDHAVEAMIYRAPVGSTGGILRMRPSQTRGNHASSD